MLKTRPIPDEIVEKDTRFNFNFNKLEAVACIVLSACISITLIVLAFRTFG